MGSATNDGFRSGVALTDRACGRRRWLECRTGLTPRGVTWHRAAVARPIRRTALRRSARRISPGPAPDDRRCQDQGSDHRNAGNDTGSRSTSPPTSSSWMNLVERWFAELTTKKLQRSTHRSVRPTQPRHPRLDRHLERQPPPLRLGEDRRPDPRLDRQLLQPN
jgi:hypothetical protein